MAAIVKKNNQLIPSGYIKLQRAPAKISVTFEEEKGKGKNARNLYKKTKNL